jgi:hypothetical protein
MLRGMVAEKSLAQFCYGPPSAGLFVSKSDLYGFHD